MNDDYGALLMRIGAPPREFWEQELEMPATDILKKAVQPGFIDRWIAGRPKRMLNLLNRLLMFGGVKPTPARAAAMHGQAALVPFVLVHEFLKQKSKSAVLEYAPQLLPEPLLDLCHAVTGQFDPLCLAFALYHHAPTELLTLLCLDKVYRSGFARMRLLRNIRRPQQPLVEFLTSETIRTILETFDREQADDRQSELKRILEHNGRLLVFVRRSQRPDHILRDNRMVHGYRPEWIILDFIDGGKRLNIASQSTGVALGIADRIAVAYFGKDCHYGGESLMTEQAQLCRLLESLRAERDPQMMLLEINVGASPLPNAPPIRIGAASRSIAPALDYLEQKIGNLMTNVDVVKSVRVSFQKKRILVSFERLRDGEFVVRYADQRLLPADRKAFENHLKDHYEIIAVSTWEPAKRAA